MVPLFPHHWEKHSKTNASKGNSLSVHSFCRSASISKKHNEILGPHCGNDILCKVQHGSTLSLLFDQNWPGKPHVRKETRPHHCPKESPLLPASTACSTGRTNGECHCLFWFDLLPIHGCITCLRWTSSTNNWPCIFGAKWWVFLFHVAFQVCLCFICCKYSSYCLIRKKICIDSSFCSSIPRPWIE